MKTKTSRILIGLGILLVVVAIIAPYLGTPYLRAAKAGGDYLVRHMRDDGSFIYEYDPVTWETRSSYNILRHAGATYSLLELYDATGSNRYLEAAEHALEYLNNQIVPCPEPVEGPAPTDAMCVEEDNEIKLGGNGLAILAFAEYARVTNNEQYIPQAQLLARYILATQDAHGEFTAHKIDATTGMTDPEFTSLYYPGEAIFALTRLHEVDGEPVWMSAAHAGAQWIIGVRDVGVTTDDLEHDHWLLYGLSELYADEPNEMYLVQARRITQAIAAAQHVGMTGDRADWEGGFYNPPRSTPTATRSEGLGAAYAIFVAAGDTVYAEITRQTMERAIGFQLRTQFTGRELARLDGDPRAAGGFHESLDEHEVRIDYVQHNVSALLAFERINEQ